MSFFEEFVEDSGGEELKVPTAAGRTINFSGKDGEYTEKDKETGAVNALHTIEKVVVFWMLDGKVLWPGSGAIPRDGDAPLCRSEKSELDIAALNPKINVVSLAVMKSLGYTGNCQTCGLSKWANNEKPLCRNTATLYVIDPDAEPSQDAIHRIVFSGPSVVGMLKERINGLRKVASDAGKPYAAFVVRLGSEKVEGRSKSDVYRVPTFAIDNAREVSAEWLASLGVEARIMAEDVRTRPSWALNPARALAAPALQAALVAGKEMEGIDEVPF